MRGSDIGPGVVEVTLYLALVGVGAGLVALGWLIWWAFHHIHVVVQ